MLLSPKPKAGCHATHPKEPCESPSPRARDMSNILTAGGFDTFLYAPIGQDKNGVPLSMLSLFARRDTDPWEEAEKLCRLPKASAVAELSAMLDTGAPHTLAAPDQALLAARLIGLLPTRREAPHELGTLLTSALSKKRNASIAYGVAIVLLYLGLAWLNT